MDTTGRAEVVTVGVDEAVQGFGGDPFGRSASLGLRIPKFVPANAGHPGLNRYLFLLSTFSLPDNGKAFLRGFRQLVTLGVNTSVGEGPPPPRIVEQLITSPFWHFVDGDISWHLQDLGPPNGTGIPWHQVPPPGQKFNADNFLYRNGTSPGLLYESAALTSPYYVNLAAYVPPNGGKPWGTPLIEGGFSTVYDLRTPWRAAEAWHSLSIPLKGPRTIALYASVKQHVAGFEPLTPPGTFYPNGLSDEEQFLLNFSQAQYWRIAGGLIVDDL